MQAQRGSAVSAAAQKEYGRLKEKRPAAVKTAAGRSIGRRMMGAARL